MEAFNIKILVQKQEITLTILPKDDRIFKVIYYGGILGAVTYHEATKTWEKVANEDAINGDLPLYHNDKDEDRVEVDLHDENVARIGREIQMIHSI